VSTAAQKDDLDRQVKTVSNYCAAKGYQFKIIADIGSGLNYNKPGLRELVTLICTNQITHVVLNYKDRLARNGFELIEQMCQMHNVQIEIINLNENTNEAELVEDVLAIITVYSAKLYGSRSHKNKKIVETNKTLFLSED
jgi:predicted site-specific integrase-resolvase